MKLLFVTQSVDEEHDDLGFVVQWVDAFIAAGYEVEVVCLEQKKFDGHFPVYSLGKERGYSKLYISMRFIKFALTHQYDRVFVHMNPEYFTLAGWWWYLNRIPMYLWYTHYTTHIHLKLAAFYCQYMFAATKQSLPQYENSPKRIITGHGINTKYWKADNQCADDHKLLTVHRLSRSKRVEISIETLKHLPEDYTLDIYGRAVDDKYFNELQELVKKLELENRVTFHGPVVMDKLKEIYPQYRLMLNMASETIDKTMVESMMSGIYPVTTPGNSEAIGLPHSPKCEEAEALAEFILEGKWREVAEQELQTIVEEKHDLNALVRKISRKIND